MTTHNKPGTLIGEADPHSAWAQDQRAHELREAEKIAAKARRDRVRYERWLNRMRYGKPRATRTASQALRDCKPGL